MFLSSRCRAKKEEIRFSFHINLVKKVDFKLTIFLNEFGLMETYELDSSCILGRDESCGIPIFNPSKTVSSQHCTLILMPKSKEDSTEYYLIRDGVFNGKPSSNGTFVNGKRILQLTRLSNQDEITFGARHPRAVFSATRREINEKEQTFLPS